MRCVTLLCDLPISPNCSLADRPPDSLVHLDIGTLGAQDVDPLVPHRLGWIR